MTQNLKVLFLVRHNFYSSPGGAQIQILKTSEELKKLGCECDISTDPNSCDFKKYDIVNVTDLTWIYDLLEYQAVLTKQNTPFVLTTIYWPFDDYVSHAAPLLQRILYYLIGINGTERLKALYKFIRKREWIYLQGVFHGYISSQRRIAKAAEWMLPNSEMEMAALNQRLGLQCQNYSVVNNAIDLKAFLEEKEKNTVARDENMILFVGRIDPRKNQLKFLEAIYDTPYKVCFIGQPGPNSKYYYKRLVELGEKRGNTEFVAQIPQNKVFEYMLRAKIHVLPSWVETPGLVSLEAYYAGCNVVVADKGSVREYFQEEAFYCDPADKISILNAVNAAMKSSYTGNLAKKIETEYTWKFAAEQTFAAYQKILQMRKNS